MSDVRFSWPVRVGFVLGVVGVICATASTAWFLLSGSEMAWRVIPVLGIVGWGLLALSLSAAERQMARKEAPDAG